MTRPPTRTGTLGQAPLRRTTVTAREPEQPPTLSFMARPSEAERTGMRERVMVDMTICECVSVSAVTGTSGVCVVNSLARVCKRKLFGVVCLSKITKYARDRALEREKGLAPRPEGPPL